MPAAPGVLYWQPMDAFARRIRRQKPCKRIVFTAGRRPACLRWTGAGRGIDTPLDLYGKLSQIWCAETCAPRLRARWTPENRTLGQCSITAFLVQDLFGGQVYGILRPGGNYHCYNVVGGHVFDLTSEQFGGGGPLLPGQPGAVPADPLCQRGKIPAVPAAEAAPAGSLRRGRPGADVNPAAEAGSQHNKARPAGKPVGRAFCHGGGGVTGRDAGLFSFSCRRANRRRASASRWARVRRCRSVLFCSRCSCRACWALVPAVPVCSWLRIARCIRLGVRPAAFGRRGGHRRAETQPVPVFQQEVVHFVVLWLDAKNDAAGFQLPAGHALVDADPEGRVKQHGQGTRVFLHSKHSSFSGEEWTTEEEGY